MRNNLNEAATALELLWREVEDTEEDHDFWLLKILDDPFVFALVVVGIFFAGLVLGIFFPNI